MKKIILSLLSLMLVTSIVLSGCTKPTPTPAAPTTPTPTTPAEKEKEWVPPVLGMKPGEEDKYFVWTYAESSVRPKPPPPFEIDPRENWWGELEKRTQGRFKVQYAWAGILGAPTEILAMIGAGVAEMGMTAGMPVAEFALTQPLAMAFFTGDLLADAKIWDYSRNHPICTAQLAKQNLVYGWTLQFGTANHPLFRKGTKRIEKVEDLNGLQFGSSPGALHVWAKELGMVPVDIAIFNYYEGMQRGMIDVCAVDYSALHLTFRLDEVIDSVLEYPLSAVGVPGFINKDEWDSLPQYIKDLWWELYPTYLQEYNATLKMRGIELTKEFLREKGIEMYKLPPSEEAKLNAAAAPAWAMWAEDQARYTSEELTRQYLKDCISYRDSIMPEPFTLYKP